MDINFIKDGVVICFFGAVGAVAYILLNGWTNFKRVQLPGDKGQIIQFGSLGNLIIGAIASFLIWVTGLGNPNPPQSYGLAIIDGLLASRILSDYTKNRTLNYIGKAFVNEFKETKESEQVAKKNGEEGS